MFKFASALIATTASVNAWNPWDNPSGGKGQAQEYFGAANDFGQSMDGKDADWMSADPWQNDWKNFEFDNDTFKDSLGDGGSNVFSEALNGMNDIFTGRENYYNTINKYSGSAYGGVNLNKGLGDISSMGDIASLGDIGHDNYLGKGVNALGGYGNDSTLSNGALSSDYGYGDLGYGSVGYGNSGYGNTGYGSYGGYGDAGYGSVGLGGYGSGSYGAGYGSGYGDSYGSAGYGDSYGNAGYGDAGYGYDNYGSTGYGSGSYGSAGYGSTGYGSYGDSYGYGDSSYGGYGKAGYSTGQMW